MNCGWVTKLPEDDFADLIVYGFPKNILRTPEDDFIDLIICRLRKIVLRTPEDNFTDSIIYGLRKILRTPDDFASARKTVSQIATKNNSADSRKMLPWAHHRRSANFRTGFLGKPQPIITEVVGFP